MLSSDLRFWSLKTDTSTSYDMGLLPDTYTCGLRMRRERFPRHRLQRQPLVSDPGMHHGTCATHVPWCMSGSLTHGGGENVPGIPGACATHNVTYLARGPCQLTVDQYSITDDGMSKYHQQHYKRTSEESHFFTAWRLIHRLTSLLSHWDQKKWPTFCLKTHQGNITRPIWCRRQFKSISMIENLSFSFKFPKFCYQWPL